MDVSGSAGMRSRVDKLAAFKYDSTPGRLEESLVGLGRIIAQKLLRVSESAHETRASIGEIRSTLLAAVGERCDALLAAVDTAEAKKIALFERDLVSVDSVLTNWRSVCECLNALAVSGTQETDILSDLAARIESVENGCIALPSEYVDPGVVELSADVQPVIVDLAKLGAVCAPGPVAASDLFCFRIPEVWPVGYPLRFWLDLRATGSVNLRRLPHHVLAASLTISAASARLSLASCSGGALRLPIRFTAAPALKRIDVEVDLSALGLGESSLQINAIYVAGARLVVACLPAVIRVKPGIAVPRTIQCPDLVCDTFKFTLGCLSRSGFVYVLLPSTTALAVFDAVGTRIVPDIELRTHGVVRVTGMAISDGDAPSLLLGYHGESESGDQQAFMAIMALDVSLHVANGPADTLPLVRWNKPVSYGSGDIEDITVFPSAGIAVYRIHDSLYGRHLADGKKACDARVTFPPYSPSIVMAGDPSRELLYLMQNDRMHLFPVSLCHRNFGTCASRPGNPDMMVDVRTAGNFVVVPPTSGKIMSHLVVTVGEAYQELRVYALPDGCLIHTYTLESRRYGGLALDPSGGALVFFGRVADGSLLIDVVRWPFRDMDTLY